MELSEAHPLLRADPLPLEMGVQRLGSGQLLVAARTDMYRCNGEMFEWWFRFAPDTQQYAWWHPLDHVSSTWRETNPRTHVGSTHVVEEKLGGDEVLKLPSASKIRPSPSERTPSGRPASKVTCRRSCAVTSGSAMTVRVTRLVGRSAAGWPTSAATPNGAWCCAAASGSASALRTPVPDEAGLGLMQHAYTEFHYLSRFLPSLYIAENRDTSAPPFPW